MHECLHVLNMGKHAVPVDYWNQFQSIVLLIQYSFVRTFLDIDIKCIVPNGRKGVACEDLPVISRYIQQKKSAAPDNLSYQYYQSHPHQVARIPRTMN